MPRDALGEVGSLRRGRYYYFPVVPGRIEFAAELRRAILEEMPGVEAVELPYFLGPKYKEAVDRLPSMSVLVKHGAGG